MKHYMLEGENCILIEETGKVLGKIQELSKSCKDTIILSLLKEKEELLGVIARLESDKDYLRFKSCTELSMW